MRALPSITPKLPTTNAGRVGLLGSMTAIGAMAGDIYLPSLPEVVSDLNTTQSLAQATITLTMLGGGLGQFLVGPLSDRFGRRIPVLIGLAVHVATSLAITVCGSIYLLLGLRVIMGVANASANVVALAVIRDLYTGSAAARMFSRLMLVIGVAPLLAPSLGTYLAHVGGWRFAFVFLAVLGVALWLLVLFKLPDTRGIGPDTVRQRALPAYRRLLRDRSFLALALVPGFSMGAMMSWVISSPFLIRTVFHLDSWHFAAVFAVGGVCLVVGSQLNAGIVPRLGPTKLLRSSVPLALVVALIWLGLALAGVGGLTATLVPLCVAWIVLGLVPANASALAMNPYGDIAGAAAAMIGGIQVATAGAVMALMGQLEPGSVTMSGVIAGCLAAALLVLTVGTKVYRRAA